VSQATPATVAIDAGQTGMKVRVRTDTSVGEAVLPGVRTDLPVLAQIGAAARQIADEFDLDIRHLAAGISGLTDAETAPSRLRELASGAGARRAVIAHDATTSYLGALGTAHGAVVAAGTGVVTLGVGPAGVARVDGWGYLMGDAGSGFWLGREGLVAAMRDHDGRGQPTAITAVVRRRWPDLEQAYIDLQADPARVSIVASFAAEVARAGADGDEVALGILRRAGDLLAESALTALRRAGVDADPAVCAIGGVFRSKALREEFAAALRRGRADARVVDAAGVGIDGVEALLELPAQHPLAAFTWSAAG